MRRYNGSAFLRRRQRWGKGNSTPCRRGIHQLKGKSPLQQFFSHAQVHPVITVPQSDTLASYTPHPTSSTHNSINIASSEKKEEEILTPPHNPSLPRSPHPQSTLSMHAETSMPPQKTHPSLDHSMAFFPLLSSSSKTAIYPGGLNSQFLHYHSHPHFLLALFILFQY